MSAFSARLRLPGQSRIPLGVEVDVSDERITLRSGDRKVAQWSLDSIDIIQLADGFHIKVDDEEAVLSVTESTRFASELGVMPARPTPRKRTPVSSGRVSEADALRQRISETAHSLSSDDVAPETAFAEWLGLLKELNTRHARGAMTTPLFHELNTELLNLIPTRDPALQ